METWKTPAIRKFDKRTDSWYSMYEEVCKETGRIVVQHIELSTEPELDLENRGKNWNERA